jgi:hypothetical protein
MYNYLVLLYFGSYSGPWWGIWFNTKKIANEGFLAEKFLSS